MKLSRILILFICFLKAASFLYADKLDDELFLLKVADAKRCGWDTVPAFRHRCKVEQGKALRAVLLDAGRQDSVLHALYRESVERYSAKGWVKLEEIVRLLPQRATRNEVGQVCRQMDSVYVSLQGGMPFEIYLEQGCEAQWCPSVALLKEFSCRLDTMRKGTYTKPFLSPLGVHIIKLVDRKPAISYEEASPFLEIYLDRLGEKNPALNRSRYMQWQHGERKDVAVERCLTEVKNCMLAAWWDVRHPLPDVSDENELKHFFEANKKAYAWEFPHYKGAVVLCKDKKSASRIRKCLKKVPMEQMEEVFRMWQAEHPEVDAVIQVGLFQIGKNPYIDKLAFKCGEMPHDPRYPYAIVVGKRLKKGPENYTDAYGQVKKDFVRTLKMRQLEELRTRVGK